MSAMNAQEPEQFPETGKVRLLRRRVRPRVSLRNRVHAEKLRQGIYLIQPVHGGQHHVRFLFRPLDFQR